MRRGVPERVSAAASPPAPLALAEPSGWGEPRGAERCRFDPRARSQPLLFTALLPHGLQYPWGVSTIATLDHSMWFHGPLRADEWLLYEMTSPSASRGHALAFGHLYRIDNGQLVVSCAQQGLIRVAKPSVASSLRSAAIPRLARWLRSWRGAGGGREQAMLCGGTRNC